MVRCIVFDFDGTLVDSNAVKQRAYFDIFPPPYRPHVESVLRDRKYANRFEKIDLIVRRMTGTPPAQEEIARYAAAYNDICEAHQATCDERRGAGKVLARLATRIPLYLWSGTFEVPLRRIVSQRGWSGFFRGIFGSPDSKADNLARIALHAALPCEALLVVGDTCDDLDAATACGCQFAGIVSDATDFDRNRIRVIPDLIQLEAMC